MTIERPPRFKFSCLAYPNNPLCHPLPEQYNDGGIAAGMGCSADSNASPFLNQRKLIQKSNYLYKHYTIFIHVFKSFCQVRHLTALLVRRKIKKIEHIEIETRHLDSPDNSEYAFSRMTPELISTFRIQKTKRLN